MSSSAAVALRGPACGANTPNRACGFAARFPSNIRQTCNSVDIATQRRSWFRLAFKFCRPVRHGQRLPDTPATNQPAARARARGSMLSAERISSLVLVPPALNTSQPGASRLPAAASVHRQLGSLVSRCRCAVCRAHRYPPRAPPNRAQSPSTAVA